MITFKELANNLKEIRVVNMVQRRKMARKMRKLAKSSAFKAKKVRAMLRIASPEKIQMKARKLAKKKIVKKYYPNYNELSPQMKIKIDQRIASRFGGIISKIAQRAVKNVRRNEILKVKKARGPQRQQKQMRKLEKFSLYEALGKGEVVFTFGRFNPPTTGHEKLINKVKSVAGSNDYKIFPSHTQNQNKDPLPHSLKIAYMRKMFPRHARNIIADKKAMTAMNIATSLYDQGYTELTMVVGSDRVREFERLLTTYNNVSGKRHGFYNFKKIKVVSAGDRDPDADDVSGMSASKMRQVAVDGKVQEFESGVPSGFRDGRKLYRDVRKFMGIREEKDMGIMNDYESLRDAYLTGKIWNIGDIVEANNVQGKIIQRGTNYVAFKDETNKVHKAWLNDIKEEKDKRKKEVKQDKDIKDREGTQPAKYYAKDAEGDTMSKVQNKQGQDTLRNMERKMTIWIKIIKMHLNDAGGKTKPSVHTKKYQQMFGKESIDVLDEKISGLVKKAEKSGMPYSILKKVYDRGMDPHGKQDTDLIQHHNSGHLLE